MYNLMFTPDRTAKKPVYEQLYEFIAQLIRAGELSEGERLPSKKALAAHLGISVNTVETAYGILADEGYVRAKSRSGHYVRRAELPPYESPHLDAERTEKKVYGTDFKTNAVDSAAFPYSTWIRLMREVMYSHPEYMSGGEMKGDRELRESIAKYLHEFRGVVCSPSQIVIGAGLEYLIMLLAQLSRESSIIAIEDPGYKKAAMIFKNGGREVRYIGVDSGGLRVDELEKSGSSIVYVTPSHQFPTGFVMPADRRAELLAWADGSEGRYIIEDDYNSEFNFSKRPVRAMQAYGERVIYISTLSRVIAPSIRVAYMVLPKRLLTLFEQRFGAYAPTVPRYEQHTLARFISDGYFSRHIARMKMLYGKKRTRLLGILEAAGFEVSGCIGLHAVVRTPAAKEIIRRAKENGIRLCDMDDYYFEREGPHDSLIIGYAGSSEADMQTLERFFRRAL